METVRPAVVAGLFYPASPDVLNNMIEQDLAGASPANEKAVAKALIVPHAGFIYSGPIAASAYVYLQQLRHIIQRVVIIGPSHRVGFEGLALCLYG